MSVEISTTEGVTERERAYAIDKVGRLADTFDAPILHADIRLEMSQDPARERPAHARVLIDLNGEPVRARVAGGTMMEAIDLLEQRLRRRFESVAEHRQALRRRGATSPPGEWRHGDLPIERPPYFNRPVSDRTVVTHKSFSTDHADLDEAIFDLESMDYDFYLFTDSVSGSDALVWRGDDGQYHVQFADGADSHDATCVALVEVEPLPVPRLTLDAAQEALDTTGDPWEFYRDDQTDRGRVLYRRYDGHYGLITPVTDSVSA